MKETVYKCNHCEKVLSCDSEKIHKKHLSINFGAHSGQVDYIFSKYGNSARAWSYIKKLEGIKQFCDTKCMAKFMDGLRAI